MNSQNEKKNKGARRFPISSGEISWALLLLGLCLILNAWLGVLSPDPQDTAKAVPMANQASPKVPPAAAAPERLAEPLLGRERPAERASSRRNAETGSLPGF